MQLLLVRHGEAQDNANGVIMGQRNSPLTTVGKRQAATKAAGLSTYQLDAIYCSDLGRCVETAQIIINKVNPALTPTQDARLRETSFGTFEGQPYDAITEDYMADLSKHFDKGESNQDMIHRVLACMNDIYLCNPEDTILVVTHSGPLAVIIASLTGKSYSQAIADKVSFDQIITFDVTKPLTIG